jgi:hypothetical protein
MTSYVDKIAEYIDSRKPNAVGYKNISKNTGIPPKYVFRTLRLPRFIKVNGTVCGTARLTRSYYFVADQ